MNRSAAGHTRPVRRRRARTGQPAIEQPERVRIVAGKTAVRAPRPLLDRPRLTTALKAGLDGQLTVVTGPPGAGKTVLSSMVATGTDRATAWLTLDPEDNDPVRLWRHLLWALRGARVPLTAPL